MALRIAARCGPTCIVPAESARKGSERSLPSTCYQRFLLGRAIKCTRNVSKCVNGAYRFGHLVCWANYFAG